MFPFWLQLHSPLPFIEQQPCQTVIWATRRAWEWEWEWIFDSRVSRCCSMWLSLRIWKLLARPLSSSCRMAARLGSSVEVSDSICWFKARLPALIMFRTQTVAPAHRKDEFPVLQKVGRSCWRTIPPPKLPIRLEFQPLAAQEISRTWIGRAI